MINCLKFYSGIRNTIWLLKYIISWRKIKISGLKYSLTGHAAKFKTIHKLKMKFASPSEENLKIKKESLLHKLLIDQSKLEGVSSQWNFWNLSHPWPKKSPCFSGLEIDKIYKHALNFTRKVLRKHLNQEISTFFILPLREFLLQESFLSMKSWNFSQSVLKGSMHSSTILGCLTEWLSLNFLIIFNFQKSEFLNS